MNRNSIKKPSIKIYYDKDKIEIEDFYQLLLGIEEEGIPYEVLECEENDAIKLGYSASLDSIIGVGVGVSKENIVLHYNRLQEDCPVYTIKTKNSKETLRALGANAARLVIRMPFKEI